MRYNFFASVGPPVKSGMDPIYIVANRFSPASVTLFTSDELATKSDRGTVEQNYLVINEYFIKAGVKTDLIRLKMEEFDENVVKIASTVIKSMTDNSKPVIFDLTAGRGAISHAMAKAGQLVVDYFKLFKDEKLVITCAIKPYNSELITFEIGTTTLPNKKDLQLLKIVEKKATQTTLAQELRWNNQSEISKSLQRLGERGLIDQKGHSNRKLTTKGRLYRRFLKDLNEI